MRGTAGAAGLPEDQSDTEQESNWTIGPQLVSRESENWLLLLESTPGMCYGTEVPFQHIPSD